MTKFGFKNLIIVLMLAGLTVGILGCVKTLPDDEEPVDQEPVDTEITTTTSLAEVDTRDWKTYTNKEYGFELRYPDNLVPSEHEDITLMEEQFNKIYFLKETADSDFSMIVGCFFDYQNRDGDRIKVEHINKHGIKFYRPGEGEYVIYRNDGKPISYTFHIYELEQENYDLSRLILNSFRFVDIDGENLDGLLLGDPYRMNEAITDPSNVFSCTYSSAWKVYPIPPNEEIAKVDISSWETYKNEGYGLTIKHPSEWTFVELPYFGSIEFSSTGKPYDLDSVCKHMYQGEMTITWYKNESDEGYWFSYREGEPFMINGIKMERFTNQLGSADGIKTASLYDIILVENANSDFVYVIEFHHHKIAPDKCELVPTFPNTVFYAILQTVEFY